jgi:hypothetical protein
MNDNIDIQINIRMVAVFVKYMTKCIRSIVNKGSRQLAKLNAQYRRTRGNKFRSQAKDTTTRTASAPHRTLGYDVITLQEDTQI